MLKRRQFWPVKVSCGGTFTRSPPPLPLDPLEYLPVTGESVYLVLNTDGPTSQYLPKWNLGVNSRPAVMPFMKCQICLCNIATLSNSKSAISASILRNPSALIQRGKIKNSCFNLRPPVKIHVLNKLYSKTVSACSQYDVDWKAKFTRLDGHFEALDGQLAIQLTC